MALSVPRHEFLRDDLPGRDPVLGEGVMWALENLQEAPEAIADAMSDALLLAQERSVPDPAARWLETWEAWVIAMQAGSAMFAVAATTSESVECLVHHEMRLLPASGPRSWVNAGTWINVFYLSVICGDKARLDALCEIESSLLQASGAEFDAYIHPWLEALRSYWLSSPDLGDHLLQAAQGLAPEAAQISGPETTMKILWPVVDLFHRFVIGDHDQFNLSLANALTLHKQYWTGDEGRARDARGPRRGRPARDGQPRV
ncbi:immunity 49 family protein [Streptomyces sp. NRRL F-4428]|uniref:immunity 49 family protein n=1 Tax=Streptomyces sp. NRRL F-4428 TaxID=1609137 RepID=UPI000696330F|nr:immunity 49 family protein [Streptomyces sp. NRRL F-4428]